VRYISTRGRAPTLPFDDVLLTGLARDGGLYVPDEWPSFDADALRALRGLPYAELAARLMQPFLGDAIDPATFRRIAADAYAGFDHQAVAPLVQLDQKLWLQELFHGPTIAFKDYAMQLLGRLFDHVLAQRRQRVTIVGATSGDTGSAAIEACRDREAIDIFILYPHGRVSEVQRRQMTTVPSANVHTLAVEGSFDDCQDLVKAMFNDAAFRDELSLSAVNSINWARIMAQIVYYAAAAVALGAPDRRVAFSVPTGNFGNVYAAYGARAMGLPIERLIVGANRNDILDRFFRTGEMRVETVSPTLAPSMDIQVSSNFERLLFDLHDRDGGRLADDMAAFRATGAFRADDAAMARARAVFSSHRLDDDGIRATIGAIHRANGMLIDPHTAVGVAAAQACRLDPDIAVVALGCAHPAKFPDAVEAATGVRPALPRHLADLFERPERIQIVPNALDTVQQYIRGKLAAEGRTD
jgi:threonine synthase